MFLHISTKTRRSDFRPSVEDEVDTLAKPDGRSGARRVFFFFFVGDVFGDGLIVFLLHGKKQENNGKKTISFLAKDGKTFQN